MGYDDYVLCHLYNKDDTIHNHHIPCLFLLKNDSFPNMSRNEIFFPFSIKVYSDDKIREFLVVADMNK